MRRIPGTTAAYAILAMTLACLISMAAGFGWAVTAWVR
jgi:hypothetical protein